MSNMVLEFAKRGQKDKLLSQTNSITSDARELYIWNLHGGLQEKDLGWLAYSCLV